MALWDRHQGGTETDGQVVGVHHVLLAVLRQAGRKRKRSHLKGNTSSVSLKHIRYTKLTAHTNNHDISFTVYIVPCLLIKLQICVHPIVQGPTVSLHQYIICVYVSVYEKKHEHWGGCKLLKQKKKLPFCLDTSCLGPLDLPRSLKFQVSHIPSFVLHSFLLPPFTERLCRGFQGWCPIDGVLSANAFCLSLSF